MDCFYDLIVPEDGRNVVILGTNRLSITVHVRQREQTNALLKCVAMFKMLKHRLITLFCMLVHSFINTTRSFANAKLATRWTFDLIDHLVLLVLLTLTQSLILLVLYEILKETCFDSSLLIRLTHFLTKRSPSRPQ